MTAATLMIQGTTSDAGKSTVVAALCRVLRRRGVGVAPFKPQNMALNSFVTPEGGEIGRAQAMQAYAAGIEPHVDMNPVLLKPNSETGSQVVLLGKPMANLEAVPYHRVKPTLMPHVLAAHGRLVQSYQAVVVEGAGSPAEINLRDHDIANMGFAEAVDCPVVLVGDIDRGGVFAQFVGTLELLSPSERARVKGFIVNRFRGQRELLTPGLEWLEARTGVPVLGVLPYLTGLYLEAEDSFFGYKHDVPKPEGRVRVGVFRFPRLSNHTDVDPLRLHPEVELGWIETGMPLPEVDLLILPGSKSVRSDLAWLRANGWEEPLRRHLRYGGKVIGLCGGFQMLGDWLHDPDGIEGPSGSVRGLELLEMETTFFPEKELCRNQGALTFGGVPVTGYEIHMGQSSGPALTRPAVLLANGPDGAVSGDGRILGTYLHGLFDTPEALTILLAWAGLAGAEPVDQGRLREEGIERLADALERSCDLKALLGLMGLGHMV